MPIKNTLLALFLAAAPTLASPATPIIHQSAKSNAPWNTAVMTPLFDGPFDYDAISTDTELTSGLLFSDQKNENKRRFTKDQKIPAYLDGREFHLLPAECEHAFECAKAGDIIGIAFSSDSAALSSLNKQGFKRKNTLRLAFQAEQFPDRTLVVHTRSIASGEKITMPRRTILAGIAVPRVATGEVLHNNIVLPKHWPPHRDIHSDEPPEIPYLKSRPKLVPIDIGRQLFIDDFLIEKTTLTREFHRPEKYSGNPVLKPETELEKKSIYADCAVAAPLGGSIWWNPDKQLFEIWYEAGHITNLAYATSKDGLKWERPSLDVFPGTNKILELAPDSWSVVHDFLATDPQERYKLLMRPPNLDGRRVRIYTSPDGIHWKDHGWGGHCGDRTTFYYNPFRKKWVFSLRWGLGNAGIGRSRAYVEADDFVQGAKWAPSAPVFWARADKLDKPYNDGILENDDFNVQLYNIDACAYESILVSFFQLFYGPENSYWAKRGLPKLTGLNLAYSRDGFNWDRPDRSLAIQSTLNYGDWDCGYVQSVGNLMAVRGDKLLIYYTGFAGDTSIEWNPKAPGGIMGSGMHQNGAMGIAILRRDGFASMNAQGEGALTTRPVMFSGKHLFVNVDAPAGELLAQVTDAGGNPIAPFTFENCKGVRADTTIAQMKWKGGCDLTALAGRPVRFEFKLKQGKLYAFWVSRDESGRSDGYVAGGGPGFTSNVDTQGKNAYTPNAEFMKQLNK